MGEAMPTGDSGLTPGMEGQMLVESVLAVGQTSVGVIPCNLLSRSGAISAYSTVLP